MPDQFSRLRHGRAGAILDEAVDLYRSRLFVLAPLAALIACPVLLGLADREAIPQFAWLDEPEGPTSWVRIFAVWFEGAVMIGLGAMAVCLATLPIVLAAFTAPWSEVKARELSTRMRSRASALCLGAAAVFALSLLTNLSMVATLATLGIALPEGLAGEVFFLKLALMEGPWFVQMWLTGRLYLFPIVMLMEGCGLGASLRRSLQLTAKRQFWPFMLAVFFGANLCLACAVGAYGVVDLTGRLTPWFSAWFDTLAELVFAALLLAAAPLVTCVLTVSYFRARFIEEGLDLELAILSSTLGGKYADASYMKRHRVCFDAPLKSAAADPEDDLEDLGAPE